MRGTQHRNTQQSSSSGPPSCVIICAIITEDTHAASIQHIIRNRLHLIIQRFHQYNFIFTYLLFHFMELAAWMSVQSSSHTCLSVLLPGNKQDSGSRDPGCVGKVMARTHNSLAWSADQLPNKAAGIWTKQLLLKLQQLTAYVCLLNSLSQNKTQEAKMPLQKKEEKKKKSSSTKKEKEEESKDKTDQRGVWQRTCARWNSRFQPQAAVMYLS